MGRFVEAADRAQASFLPACFEDYVDPDNPVRVIDAFVEELIWPNLVLRVSSRQRLAGPVMRRA